VTGSIIVETIFSIPGIGRYFVDAALNRDYTLVMGTVVVIALFTIVFNLIVDILYAAIDPRVRYD
jgi:oligopeptide transport system permease protein